MAEKPEKPFKNQQEHKAYFAQRDAQKAALRRDQSRYQFTEYQFGSSYVQQPSWPPPPPPTFTGYVQQQYWPPPPPPTFTGYVQQPSWPPPPPQIFMSHDQALHHVQIMHRFNVEQLQQVQASGYRNLQNLLVSPLATSENSERNPTTSSTSLPASLRTKRKASGETIATSKKPKLGSIL